MKVFSYLKVHYKTIPTLISGGENSLKSIISSVKAIDSKNPSKIWNWYSNAKRLDIWTYEGVLNLIRLLTRKCWVCMKNDSLNLH